MPQLISKYKLYLYFFFLIFLSSIFNFQTLDNYHDKFRLKNINIIGLPYNEKKNIQIELNKLKNINIFYLKKDKVLKKLNNFNFLEKIYVNKVIPSSININISKTAILGKTIIKGKKFYIGKNGNFINSNLLSDQNNLPSVFGDFQIDKYISLIKKLKKHEIDIGNIKKYYYYKNNRWDLLFSNNLTLMLPSKKDEESIKIFKVLLDNNNLSNVKIIDLRVSNQIILTNNND
jgi:cell division septal protein FtsQ